MTALIVQDVLLFTGNLRPECECVKESPLIVALQRTHLWEGASGDTSTSVSPQHSQLKPAYHLNWGLLSDQPRKIFKSMAYLWITCMSAKCPKTWKHTTHVVLKGTYTPTLWP